MRSNSTPTPARRLCNRLPSAALVVLVLAGLAPAVASLHGEPLPNIVFLLSDDHGWEETGYNGHPYVQTPVLDEMAATGLRLDRFYAAHPSCSPTRASVLTGRHPNRMGAFAPGWSLRPEETTIAQILADAGYRCAHFGKWHVGAVKAESPVNPRAMGFHEYLSHDNFFEMDPPLSRNGGPPTIHKGESSEVLMVETFRFMERTLEAGGPFFAYVCFGLPHEPYSGIAEDLALYDELPAKYPEETSRLTCNETGLQVTRALGAVLRERYAEITAMDRAIGQLRSWLEERGLRDNTLVFYFSDNGTSRDAVLTSPLRGWKNQFYEGGVRVPAVVEWPARIHKPKVSDAIASTSDLLPTLAALVGARLPDRPLDGINLVPLLSGEWRQRPTPLFFWEFNQGRMRGTSLEPWIDPELQKGTSPLVKLMNGVATRDFQNFHHPQVEEIDIIGSRAVLGPRYKLVVHESTLGQRKAELFDLLADPAESRDLAGEKPGMVEAMSRELSEWQESVLRSLTGSDYRE
jgi:arylsulfatase A-like enzyme